MPEAELVRGLLDCEDAVFIQRAYLVALRRDPDPDGFAHYLGKLSQGVARLTVLGELAESPEGRGNAGDPMLAAMTEFLSQASADRADLSAAQREWQRLPGLQGRAFVACAYRALLGREPDNEGMHHYLARMRRGEARTAILALIRQSDECKANVRNRLCSDRDRAWLRSLDRQIVAYRLANIPLVGAVVRMFVGAELDVALHICLRRIEFALSESARAAGVPQWGPLQARPRLEESPTDADGAHALPATLTEQEVRRDRRDSSAGRSAATSLRTLAEPSNWGQEGENV